MWLLLSAILMQGLDAQSSCYNIKHGFKEVNPLMGHTCTSVATRKALLFVPYVALLSETKWGKKYLIALTVNGGIGFTINVSIR